MLELGMIIPTSIQRNILPYEEVCVPSMLAKCSDAARSEHSLSSSRCGPITVVDSICRDVEQETVTLYSSF